MFECKISTEQIQEPEIQSQSREVSAILLSPAFCVDYRGQREVKHPCPSHSTLQEAGNKQEVQMGFVALHQNCQFI